MSKVRVYNDNSYPFFQKFKDENILIQPGSFIEMEYYEAHEFKSSYSPVKLDADDNPLPSSFKRLRIVEDFEQQKVAEAPTAHSCLACEKTFPLLKDLEEHAKTHSNVFNKERIEEAQNAKAALQENYPSIDPKPKGGKQ